ncbi:MAG: putative spermidine/putrescine transport system substrate-binding protein [Chloroflexota bacterium]|jgi:putative spermidine/putrescine transport system substrate-binding protein|nr:putative spermidine/putrescine transport system substrate-binding protein [Chloroflexota bacterium]MEA2653913.1 putative spermidine/putrescine transport system substrate-binding protein [Chloroflexota bacterium]
MRIRGWLTLAAATAIVVAACSSPTASNAPTSAGGSSAPSAAASSGPSAVPSASAAAAASVGPGEGKLNLIAWAGYVVGGTGGEQITGYDWVTPFETATGCKVTVKVGLDSGNMVQLMKTGQYDGVSASGDATLRLIAGGDVAPVDFSRIPNYKDVFAGLKNAPYNTVGGVGYGVPHGRGANVLMYDPSVVKTVPDSWSVVFEANSPYKGKVTAYNYAIYIADAALYLMKTQPALKITNPYALDKDQLAAAVTLLKTQKTLIGKYWGTAQEEIDGFANGDMAVGTAWQYQANTINAAGGKQVAVVKPKEGATGWSDTWMVSSKAAHPNCMYKWMDYIISPAANAAVTVYFGEAPVSAGACAEAEKLSKGHCDLFHATDESFFADVYYWNTPTVTCLDGRGDICTDFDAWTKAWTNITGG